MMRILVLALLYHTSAWLIHPLGFQRTPPLLAFSSNKDLSDVDQMLYKCKRGCDFKEALELAAKLEVLVQKESSAVSSTPFNSAASHTVTSIIRLYGEAGELGRALSVLNRMQVEWQVAPCEHHFGALIQAARRSKQYDVSSWRFLA